MSDQTPSPYCAPCLTRKQTEEIWRLLHQQPQKKWTPTETDVTTAAPAVSLTEGSTA